MRRSRPGWLARSPTLRSAKRRQDHRASTRICAESALQSFAIALESPAARARQRQQSERQLALVCLFHFHVAALLEFREVTGEIAFCKTAFALQVEEVGFLDRVEQGHDAQPRGLVNDAIQIGELAMRLAHACSR